MISSALGIPNRAPLPTIANQGGIPPTFKWFFESKKPEKVGKKMSFRMIIK